VAPLAEYPQHSLTENGVPPVGLIFPPAQTVATSRITHKGLNLVPGGGSDSGRQLKKNKLLNSKEAQNYKNAAFAVSTHVLHTRIFANRSSCVQRVGTLFGGS